jgi:formate/nitrite transporter FocA (FNT family)
MAEKADEDRASFDEKEAEDIEARMRLRAPMIYEIVRREGEEEMDRPAASLWWSGVAAGLSISFSLLSEAILFRLLPDAPWRPLLSGFGYSVGFLMVVLARHQLFTENTITVVLPVVAEPTIENFARLGRLWGIVLAANLVGCLFSALFCTYTPVISPDLRGTMLEISRLAMEPDVAQLFFRAIAAGFLIAMMVWLLPSAENSQFFVIVLMTYLISVGEFAHVVAGSVEAFMLLIAGEIDVSHLLGHFLAPVLLGNIFGGTALFAVLSYAQVAQEM